MKSKISTCLVILLSLLTHSVRCWAVTDWEKQNFQGKVSHVKETEFEAMSDHHGTVSKSVQNLQFEYAFNESGNLTGWADLDYSGHPNWFYRIEYDSLGLMVKKSTFNFDETLQAYIDYKYDSENRLVTWSMYNEFGELRYTWTNSYSIPLQASEQGHSNPASCLYSSISVGADGEQIGVYLYACDVHGNRSSETWMIQSGKVTKKIQYEYDAAGNPVQVIHYDGQNKMTGQWHQTFDGHHRITEQHYYKSKKELVSRTLFTYDQFGNQLKEIRYNATDGLLLSLEWTYRFDDQNNWIEKTHFSNGSAIKITERVINYFN